MIPFSALILLREKEDISQALFILPFRRKSSQSISTIHMLKLKMRRRKGFQGPEPTILRLNLQILKMCKKSISSIQISEGRYMLKIIKIDSEGKYYQGNQEK